MYILHINIYKITGIWYNEGKEQKVLHIVGTTEEELIWTGLHENMPTFTSPEHAESLVPLSFIANRGMTIYGFNRNLKNHFSFLVYFE